MMHSDQPIVHQDQDILKRTPFAQKLSNAILNWHRNESVVIALCGAWGNGKTSVLNLSVEYIQNITQARSFQEKPIIVWFNPWSYSQREQLINALFTQLQAAIHKVDPKRGNNIRGSLNQFAKKLGALGDVPQIGGYAGAGVFLIDLFVKEKTLEDIKGEIAKDFLDLSRRVIILIDDVDRLTDDEIRSLFQTVKVNADFPNTIYLIAFSRDIVEKALAGQQNVSGRAYLEKIVQVSFDLPNIENTLTQKVLLDGLTDIFQVVSFRNFDENYWQNLYHSGFNEFFSSLREVKRYLNSLQMTLSMVQGEVNPVDFMALEMIRIFQPEVYKGISENRDTFLFQPNGSSDQERKEARKTLDDVFSSAKDKEILVRKICVFLFPQLAGVYANHIYDTSYYRLWRKELRICSKELFDVYFLLSVPSNSVSIRELIQITDLHTKNEDLQKIFDEYVQQGRIMMLLERLVDVIDSTNVQRIINLSTALLDFANRSPYFQKEMLQLEPDKKAIYVTVRLLEKLDEEQRFQWAVDQVQNSTSLFAIVYLIRMDQDAGRYREVILFSPEHWEFLRDVSLTRIEELAQDDTVFNQKYPISLLYRWKEWSKDKERLNLFIGEITSDPVRFAQFSSFFVSVVFSSPSGGNEVKRENYIDVNSVFELIPKETVETIVKTILENRINEIPETFHESIYLLEKGLKAPDWYQK